MENQNNIDGPPPFVTLQTDSVQPESNDGRQILIVSGITSSDRAKHELRIKCSLEDVSTATEYQYDFDLYVYELEVVIENQHFFNDGTITTANPIEFTGSMERFSCCSGPLQP